MKQEPSADFIREYEKLNNEYTRKTILMVLGVLTFFLVGLFIGTSAHNNMMKEDQIVLEGCKNYKYQSTIYDNKTPWRYIYTCEDGKQVATKLLWVE